MAKKCGSFLCEERGCELVPGRMKLETVWRMANSFSVAYGAEAGNVLSDMAARRLLSTGTDDGDILCITQALGQITQRAA